MSRIYSFLVVFIFFSCSKKESEFFSIQGHISPVTTKYLILKQETDIERQITTIIDTLYVSKDGKFSTNFSLKPHLYTLQIDAKKSIDLAIDKEQHLIININNDKSKIIGSKDTEALLAYENFRKKSLDSLVQSVRRQVKEIKKSEQPDEDKILNLEQLEVANYKKHLEELNTYIKKNIGSTIGLYATSIRWQGEKNISFYDSLVTAFETKHPNLSVSKQLREKVTRLQQTTIGGIVPNIQMKNQKGELKSLYTIHKKYILIDFWASWCGPCRSESKALNTLYKEYQKKGFEIFSVSLDNTKEKWLNALKKDHRSWTNVSSLEAFKTKAAFDYTVTSLPMNFVIDSDFKIIEKDLDEKELELLLLQLFKN